MNSDVEADPYRAVFAGRLDDHGNSMSSPSEGPHPCADFRDERSWAHDTHSLARTEVPDVMRYEHPRPGSDRRREDRDVLGVGKLACPFAVVWRRLVDLDGNGAEKLFEERRGFR